MVKSPFGKVYSEGWTVLPSFDSNPYPIGARSSLASIPSQYSLCTDPREWSSAVPPEYIDVDDDDDELVSLSKRRCPCPISWRGILNGGCLLTLFAGMLALFIGYPIITAFSQPKPSNNGGYNVGGINGTGQIPLIPGNLQLIDKDTPERAYTKTSWADGHTEMALVFSDEFNTDGRSFYPGDDPYWEAVDLHYWATNNLEWYDPEAVTTKDGSLVISLSKKQTHGLNYQGGMIATWNKFCFTGGYVEASVSLPGANNILGLWPAIWTMGNLGRAGYGASLEGLWPYSYDACDVGTVRNQSVNGVPAAATISGDASKGGVLSYLPGQRLSKCTCPGESHPGPKHSNDSFIGRAAPEIDMFEAQINEVSLVPGVSQSAQWAPFNAAYVWSNSSGNIVIPDPGVSAFNNYVGGATQQATSVITETDRTAYEANGGRYAIYGFEYKPGFDSGYITWIANNAVAWTLKGLGMGPDPLTEISARPVSQEPMYMIINLGMSHGFGAVDLENLPFPAHLRVDYIRVYQAKNSVNIGCDPKAFPTKAYIDRYIAAYTNPNLTTWVDDFQQPWPRNSFLGQC